MKIRDNIKKIIVVILFQRNAMKYFVVIFSVLLSITNSLRAQLVVDTTTSMQQLVETFFDSTGITVSNVSYTGVNSAIGYFNGDSTNLGLHEGILLTTGSIFIANGPNTSTQAGTSNGVVGDPILMYYCGYVTYDAAILEFDFIPVSDTLSFKYVFGSEEYSEWAGTAHNDIFMFFLSGPGFTDSSIAFIPGTLNYPMTVNMVNCVYPDFSQFYVCNDPFNTDCNESFNCPDSSSETTIEYDGLTIPLPAFAIVVPGETYHAKIEIADGTDDIYDSGVFLSIDNVGSGYPLSSQEYFNHSIQIFPDLVSSVVNIDFRQGGTYRVSIYDLSGKKVISKDIFKDDQIELGFLNPGMYVVECSQANDVYRQKIIKQ
jgi:hypothetical protein